MDKVLIVDDDELVLECFERLLSRHFNLDTARGPWEALNAISTKGPYTVLVSDMRMPCINGIQLLTKAKELAPDTVGIVMSGDLDETELDAAAHDMIFKVLAKPCPFDQLINAIQEGIACYHDLRKQGSIL